MQDLLMPGITPIDPKILINIGATLDVPAGKYVIGEKGESVLNGGLAPLTGIVGRGNLGKSVLLAFMAFTGMSRMRGSSGSKYDTETNVSIERDRHLASQCEEFGDEDVLDSGRWVITDKVKHYSNVWWKIVKEWLKEKTKNKAKIMRKTPFLNREGKIIEIPTPTFTALDSFTHFETEDVVEIRNENELGDSGGNTQHMRQGLAKTTFIMETPALMQMAQNYLILTAHIGTAINMASGPHAPRPAEPLKYLKNGDTIKGATGQFTFLTQNCWHVYNSVPMINQGTKAPEYPRDTEDNVELDTDLNCMSIRNLRGKFGASGTVLEIIVSQADGVLPSLTEFHNIKENGRFGINGNMQHYELDLLPGVKLSRTTVRGKIDANVQLRRALNITSEMLQIKMLYRGLPEGLMCTPKELYDSLKAKGYDWDVLLNTRGWWALDDNHPLPFLSTMDLLRMRTGQYHPYWMKPLKKE